MILIFCDTDDESALIVHNYIVQEGKDCVIINVDDFRLNTKINFCINNRKLLLHYKADNKFVRVTSIWIKKINIYKESISNSLKFLINKEISTIYDFILNNENILLLSNYSNLKLSKLQVLKLAIKYKINTPKSYILNNKEDLAKLLKMGDHIVKNSFENFMYQTKKNIYVQYVSRVERDSLRSDIPNIFFPAFFQKLIERKAEIRVFFFNNRTYSMATLTKSYKIDIKDRDQKVRNVPFQIPSSIESKLIKLLGELQINICTIDFILNKKNELFFLEINPNGNFRNISESCNYDLEFLVSKFLINAEDV